MCAKSMLKVLIIASAFIFAVPRSFNYQGKLVDASGVGVNDTLALTFRLYTSETGGAPLWEQTIPDVIVRQGLFSVELSGFPDSVDFSNQYWLEVQVGSEVFMPREKLLAAPYSIRSEYTTRAIQSIYTDSISTRRSGNILFRTGRGMTMSDRGDSIIIRIEREDAGLPPTLAEVLGRSNDANDHRITNLAYPTDGSDAATKAYVDARCGGGSGSLPQSLSQVLAVGNSAGGFEINMNNNRITNLAPPSDLNDAVTLAYVNSLGGQGLSFATNEYSINVDNRTIEIVNDTVRVKTAGIDSSQIAEGAIRSLHILDGAIRGIDIGAGEIQAVNIAENAVGALQLAQTGVSPGTYNNATITVDEDGRLIYAANGEVSGIGGSGATNYIAKFSGTHTITGSVIYESANKVGIGTSTPEVSLEINGGLRLNTTLERPTCNESTRGTLWYVRNQTETATQDVCCYTPTEGTSCTVTCPSGTITQILYVKYGATQCGNAPSCSNPSQGANCANQPTYCIGATSCTWTFNNTNCGDNCVGYNKSGALTVRCTYSFTKDVVYICMYNSQTSSYEWKLLLSSP